MDLSSKTTELNVDAPEFVPIGIYLIQQQFTIPRNRDMNLLIHIKDIRQHTMPINIKSIMDKVIQSYMDITKVPSNVDNLLEKEKKKQLRKFRLFLIL